MKNLPILSRHNIDHRPAVDLPQVIGLSAGGRVEISLIQEHGRLTPMLRHVQQRSLEMGCVGICIIIMLGHLSQILMKCAGSWMNALAYLYVFYLLCV